MACVIVTCFSSCSIASPGPEQEGVWVLKPWFFGHGGIDKAAVPTGLSYGAISTDVVYFSIVPQRYDEAFDDIFSNDNTPLDFNTYINIQIEKGKSPILLENYGEKWYENNIQVYYRNKTREYVSMYSPFDLISNREILNDIDSALLKDMTNYVAELSKSKEFPIIIRSITTGAARPNSDQLNEMNKTAAAIQAAKTQQRNKEMELARAEAERARAIADKAYQQSLGLSTEEFITMKYIDMIADKKDANIDVLIGPATSSMWNIRR